MNVTTIPASAIVAGDNDRQTFGEGDLAELAASIDAHGLAQPPTVRPMGERYEIVAGERRVRAMRDVLGWTEIPVIVRDLSDADASAIMLAENLHRVDLDPMEEARAYASRLAVFGDTVAEVALLANVSVSRVRERLALMNLDDGAAHLVATKVLPLRFAACMTRLDVNRQRLAVRAFSTTDGLSFDAFASLCRRLQSEQDQEALFDPADFMRVEEYVHNALEMALQASVTADTVDPVGQKDIATRLGVQRTTVVQWIQRPWVAFPEPKWTISDSPVWNWCDIEAWNAERESKKKGKK